MMHNSDPDLPGQSPFGDGTAGQGQGSFGQDFSGSTPAGQGSFSHDVAQPDEARRSALPFREDRDGGTQWNADFTSTPADRQAAEKLERGEQRGKIVKAAFFVIVFVFISMVFFFIRNQHREMQMGGFSDETTMGGGFGLLASLPFSPMFLFIGLFVVLGFLKPAVTALWRLLKK